MRFFSIIASAAFAAVAVAQSTVRITNPSIAPKVGETLVVTYEPATASVTLLLKNGDGRNLQTVTTIGTSSSGSITWAVPSNLPNDSYSLEIKPATGESNYVGPFRVQGATGAPTSAASSASSTRSASASSSGSVSSGSVTRSSGSTSASASVSASTNGTVSSATLSTATSSGSRPTGSGASQTTGSAPPTNTNAANALAQSPLALVFGALAAFAYLA